MLKREDAIIYTDAFLRACKSLPIKIDKAILFGSVLTGKSNEYSDIDLALFSGNFTDNILQNLDQIALVNIRFPDLDIHTYPTKDYNGNGILLDEIKRTGLEIKV
jgi:hypothetical protein